SVACGFYYYLKIVRAMYWMPVGDSPERSAPIPVTRLTRLALVGLIAATLVLGVYPEWILRVFSRF
ncbi:MAG TPA: hypothetical protein VIS74_03605, partial [Chthoniobacterales bacterium]